MNHSSNAEAELGMIDIGVVHIGVVLARNGYFHIAFGGEEHLGELYWIP